MDEFDELTSEYEQEKLKRDERLRKFLQYSEETKDLYTSLGYSEYFDTKSDEILFTLKSLITAKITNIEGFSKYRDKLIRIKNKYDEDPAAYDELCAQPNNEYKFLSAHDYEFIKKIEKAGEDNQKAYEEIICDPNNYYFLYTLPFGFKEIVYKYKDVIKAQKLFDELIDLYKYAYDNTNNDKDNIIATINGFKDSITDKYSKIGNLYIDDLIEIRHGSLFADESGWEKKDALDDVLNFALETHLDFKEANYSGYVESKKNEVIYETSKYIEAEWMHNEEITNLVMLNLFDTDYLPLKFQLSTTTTVNRNLSSAIILIIAWGMIITLSYHDYNVISWILAAFTVKYWLSITINKIESSSSEITNIEKFKKLDLIRNEILNRKYNSDIIAARLKSLEQDDIYIHSYIYTLLKLQNGKQ